MVFCPLLNKKCMLQNRTQDGAELLNVVQRKQRENGRVKKNVNPVSLSPVLRVQAKQIRCVWPPSDGKRTASLLEVSATATVTALFVEKNKI